PVRGYDRLGQSLRARRERAGRQQPHGADLVHAAAPGDSMISLLAARIARRAPCAAVLALALFACTEPRRVDQARPAPTAPLDARLELSDSLAAPRSNVIVTVRFTGSPVAS